MRPALALLLPVSVLCACRPGVDPDKGRYSCATAEDCGAGYECRAQAAGGGRCFTVGECSEVELCDGLDNTCDGRVDETFPAADAGCSFALPGPCAAGRTTCVAGAEVCAQVVFPVTERCNGLDDNCDGRADEGFDLSSDGLNCGQCGHACDGGTSCRASACAETACADGVDNDGNGDADCADPSCFGLECNAVLPPSRCGLLPGGFDAGADGGPLGDAGVDGGAGDGGVDAGPVDGGAGDGGATADGGPDGGADGGSDGGADADAGWVRGCFVPEVDCANGFDDDGDGLADCLDDDCDGRTCASGTACALFSCPGPG